MPNPAEMLSREAFKILVNYARSVYDYVIVDAPPIGSVIDAAIIAPVCDGIVLIVAAGEISRRVAQNAKVQLEKPSYRQIAAGFRIRCDPGKDCSRRGG